MQDLLYQKYVDKLPEEDVHSCKVKRLYQLQSKLFMHKLKTSPM